MYFSGFINKVKIYSKLFPVFKEKVKLHRFFIGFKEKLLSKRFPVIKKKVKLSISFAGFKGKI